MGRRNYLIEGVSGTGKTSVCTELARRGHHAVHGDRELAYQGDPVTGIPTETADHQHHLWNVARLLELVEDRRAPATFFCGGSRNFAAFIHVFDEVFVLQLDADTLRERLDQRPQNEWGAGPEERALVLKLHATQEDVPLGGVTIDATRPLGEVVDDILRHVALDSPARL